MPARRSWRWRRGRDPCGDIDLAATQTRVARVTPISRMPVAGRQIAEPGYDDPDGASIIDPEGKTPAIGWLPEGKSAKNRLHIDIRLAGEGPWDMTAREQLIRAKVPELVEIIDAALRERGVDTPRLNSQSVPSARR